MTTKILYIEDNDQNFYLVNYILSAKGYTVTRGHDGREGIGLATRENPDLILLDIQLPIMDGYDTARELRKIPDVSSTPIVALTSYAMAGDREKALAAGCTGYIEKPINPKTFTEQIQQYLPAGSRPGSGG
ncbi:MAG TPA: response regulator [Methanoregula sp.]|nr:response regulator [Methanoregula sp.]